MAGGHTRALTVRHLIKPTSTRCPSARQPNPRQTLHLSTRKSCSDNRDHLKDRLCLLHTQRRPDQWNRYIYIRAATVCFEMPFTESPLVECSFVLQRCYYL